MSRIVVVNGTYKSSEVHKDKLRQLKRDLISNVSDTSNFSHSDKMFSAYTIEQDVEIVVFLMECSELFSTITLDKN